MQLQVQVQLEELISSKFELRLDDVLQVQATSTLINTMKVVLDFVMSIVERLLGKDKAHFLRLARNNLNATQFDSERSLSQLDAVLLVLR
jgi:hypothetical protein